MRKVELPESLKEVKAFSTAEAAMAGVSRLALSRMVEHGELVRIRHGYYAVAQRLEDGTVFETDDHRAKLAALATPNPMSVNTDRVVCLETAACLHKLTTQHLGALWLAVPSGVRVLQSRRECPLTVHVVHWAAPEMFEVGVVDMAMGGRTVRVTSPERTVVDLLRFSGNPEVGVALAREALQAARDSGVAEQAIWEVAGALGCADDVRQWVLGAWRQNM